MKIIQELKIKFDDEFKKTGKRKTFHVETFGCQMNSRDSEKITGILTQIGYEEIEREKTMELNRKEIEKLEEDLKKSTK